MTSDKSYATEQRLNDLIATTGTALFGPWTKFNPLSNSWAVKGPYSGAWVRRAPGNMVFMSAAMTPGTDTDATQIGTIPSTDSDGNNLRPAQTVRVPMATDLLRNNGTNAEGAFLYIGTSGQVLCYGVSASATEAHVNCWYPLDSM